MTPIEQKEICGPSLSVSIFVIPLPLIWYNPV